MKIRASYRFLFCLTVVSVLSAAAIAQEPEPEELTIPEPEDIEMTTTDGVSLVCSWYPGGFVRTNDGVMKIDGKKVVPIIMLHEWEGNRGQFEYLAAGLQRMGHAVLVPDLRGHGQSTSYRVGNDVRRIDPKRHLRSKVQVLGMLNDVESCKKFLMDRNNLGELNIEMLTVVASEFGSLLSLEWAAQDWSWPSTPALKQGQDVKALVLLSPPKSSHALTATKSAANPAVRTQLSILIAVGESDRKAFKDAESLNDYFDRYHGENDPRTLFFVHPKTSLQGVKLLVGAGLPVSRYIATFIDIRLSKRAADLQWRDRKGA